MIKQLFSEKALALSVSALPRRLRVLDVGARGGMQWPWDRVTPGLVEVILVEPDPAEADELRKACVKAGSGSVIPVALWSENGTRALYLNRNLATSSVFPANTAFLAQFPQADRFDVLRTIEVPTRTIDDLISKDEMPSVDFAKVDVQGAELAVLQGGVRHFASNLVGLEVEVEFAELYSGQPLFAEVDAFVREELGLELWDLQKTYWKYDVGKHVPGPAKGRLVFGNGLYLRPLIGLERWLGALPTEAAREKLVMLIVSALAFGYADYATAILRAPSLTEVLEPSLRDQLQRAVVRAGALRPFLEGSSLIYEMFESLAMVFKPTHQGWASIGQQLGSRRRGPFWR